MNITETVGKVAVSFDSDCECLRIRYGKYLTNTITLVECCHDGGDTTEAEMLDYFKRLAAVPFRVDDDV